MEPAPDEAEAWERENEAWHAEARRRDAEDIAAGRRTAEEVNRENALIPNAREWVPVNLLEATLLFEKLL